MKRWHVTIICNDRAEVKFTIEELDELADIIEGGPPFPSIEKIEITYEYGAQ